MFLLRGARRWASCFRIFRGFAPFLSLYIELIWSSALFVGFCYGTRSLGETFGYYSSAFYFGLLWLLCSHNLNRLCNVAFPGRWCILVEFWSPGFSLCSHSSFVRMQNILAGNISNALSYKLITPFPMMSFQSFWTSELCSNGYFPGLASPRINVPAASSMSSYAA